MRRRPLLLGLCGLLLAAPLPPAAAAPDRKAVGSVQITGRPPKTPKAETLNRAILA